MAKPKHRGLAALVDSLYTDAGKYHAVEAMAGKAKLPMDIVNNALEWMLVENRDRLSAARLAKRAGLEKHADKLYRAEIYGAEDLSIAIKLAEEAGLMDLRQELIKEYIGALEEAGRYSDAGSQARRYSSDRAAELNRRAYDAYVAAGDHYNSALYAKILGLTDEARSHFDVFLEEKEKEFDLINRLRGRKDAKKDMKYHKDMKYNFSQRLKEVAEFNMEAGFQERARELYRKAIDLSNGGFVAAMMAKAAGFTDEIPKYFEQGIRNAEAQGAFRECAQYAKEWGFPEMEKVYRRLAAF